MRNKCVGDRVKAIRLCKVLHYFDNWSAPKIYPCFYGSKEDGLWFPQKRSVVESEKYVTSIFFLFPLVNLPCGKQIPFI